MKKFSLLLIFLLIFLFFPFPKNVGPQERPDLENITFAAVAASRPIILASSPLPRLAGSLYRYRSQRKNLRQGLG